MNFFRMLLWMIFIASVLTILVVTLFDVPMGGK